MNEELARKTEECEQLKADLATCKCNYGNEIDYQKMYKQALEEINSIAGQINLTIMGGEQSPKEEWVQLYTVTVCRILKLCDEVLND